MATASSTAATHIASSRPSFLARVLRGIRVWRDFRDTSSELSKLSRRELADIGVEGDVDGFAQRMAERRNG